MDAGRFEDGAGRPDRQVFFRVRHGDDAGFQRVLELVMATLRAGLFPSVGLQEPDDLAAAHCVYEYTIRRFDKLRIAPFIRFALGFEGTLTINPVASIEINSGSPFSGFQPLVEFLKRNPLVQTSSPDHLKSTFFSGLANMPLSIGISFDIIFSAILRPIS